MSSHHKFSLEGGNPPSQIKCAQANLEGIRMLQPHPSLGAHQASHLHRPLRPQAPFTTMHRRSPFNIIPDELLCYIFQDAVRGSVFTSPSLLLVCRHWHGVAMKDTLFWSFIHVRYDDRADTKQAAYIAASLERSRATHLDITLDYSAFDAYSEETGTIQKSPESIDAALRHVDRLRGPVDTFTTRWRSLRLLLPYDDGDMAFQILNRFEGIRAPNLKDLLIERDIVFPNEGPVSEAPILLSTPNLDHLSTSYIDLRRLMLAPDSLQRLHAVVDAECGSVVTLFEQANIEFLDLRNFDYEIVLHDFEDDDEINIDNPLLHWDKVLADRPLVTFGRLTHLVVVGLFPPKFYSLCQFPVLRTLESYEEFALDIFFMNKTYFSSIRKIIWHPPKHIRTLARPGHKRSNPVLIEKVAELGRCKFPSLIEMVLPRCCVPLAYPSLAGKVTEPYGIRGAKHVSVLINKVSIHWYSMTTMP